MSRHEDYRRKLQDIRDSLLDINDEWFELTDKGVIANVPDNESQIYCPGDVSYLVSKLIEYVKHDESMIEKLLKKGTK